MTTNPSAGQSDPAASPFRKSGSAVVTAEAVHALADLGLSELQIGIYFGVGPTTICKLMMKQFAGDVARTFVAEKPGSVLHMGLVTA